MNEKQQVNYAAFIALKILIIVVGINAPLTCSTSVWHEKKIQLMVGMV